MAAPQKPSNQEILVGLIADAVHNKLQAEIRALSTQNASLALTLNTLLARMSTIEAAIATPPPAGKRQVKAPAAAAKKPAVKAGKKTGSVTNALLFFRRAMVENIDGLRDTYATQENLDEADADPSVSKVDKTQEAAYYSAFGAYMWKVLTEAQKEEVRTKYAAWKVEQARATAEEPLEEDDAA